MPKLTKDFRGSLTSRRYINDLSMIHDHSTWIWLCWQPWPKLQFSTIPCENPGEVCRAWPCRWWMAFIKFHDSGKSLEGGGTSSLASRGNKHSRNANCAGILPEDFFFAGASGGCCKSAAPNRSATGWSNDREGFVMSWQGGNSRSSCVYDLFIFIYSTYILKKSLVLVRFSLHHQIILYTTMYLQSTVNGTTIIL